MHNLLNFLVKNSYWFVFILLEIICFYFIFSENSYQRSVFLNSSNEVSGRVYATASAVTSYFGLKSDNLGLLEQNGALLNRVKQLEERIFELEKDSVKTRAFLESGDIGDSEYIVARVINNSVSKIHNFMTLNRGAKDGIKEGMGVISHDGVVGEIRAVSDNFSVVQSLLNADSKFSCKLYNNNVFGPIEWLGGNPRYAIMREYPAHEKVALGDTVVTSGYSDVFPSGVLVGTVSEYVKQADNSQYVLTIELATDFNSLKDVLVVRRTHLEEKQKLEKKFINAQD